MHLKFLFGTVDLATFASTQSLSGVLQSQNKTLSTLISLLANQTEVTNALTNAKNITILAPNNAAFESYMSETGGAAASIPANSSDSAIAALLQYHVLQGTFNSSLITNQPMFLQTLLNNASFSNVTGGQRVEAVKINNNVTFISGLRDNSSVTMADIPFNGGLINIINSILTVPLTPSRTAQDSGLTSLVGALSEANLVLREGTTHIVYKPAFCLNDVSDITIFAPDNSAFQAIGSAVGNLSTSELSSILQYHVVPNLVGYSSELRNMTLQTVAGGNVTISLINGDVYVNSARVVLPNAMVANGVVHILDNVLNPNNTSVQPVATASTESPAFTSASSVSNVPFTSGVSATTTVGGAGATGSMSPSTSSAGAARATGATGVVGIGVLLGGAAIFAAGM